MGRGKPFVQPVTQMALRAGGKNRRPGWMSAVEMTPPQFEPVVRTRPPKIVFPEDALRETFLQRNPHARRLPVNLNALTIPERHIADRFVSLQMQLMDEQNLSEEDAYQSADRIICSEVIESQRRGGSQDAYGSLVDAGISDEEAKLYLASLRDSERDMALHRAFVKEKKGK